jgi:hypothetical protein
MEEEDFSLGNYTVEQVWRYRRLEGSGPGVKAGEVSLQNWNGPGNDYREGYVFAGVSSLNKSNWQGGLNSSTLREAEARSLRFHEWFREQAGLPLQATGRYFGSCNGCSRLPYIRDGRRSVGYKNFTLKGSDVAGAFVPQEKLTGTVFEDRLGLGFYNMDLHSLKHCSYPPFAQSQPLPFFLPARAFSNNQVANLIVAGRAMAQEFEASMATRTHATELASGVASMLLATYMSGAGQRSVWQLLDCAQCVAELQEVVRRVMPLEWTINGRLYPSQDSSLS